jgi:hypothetical protein
MNAVRALITIGIAALWVALFAPPMFMAPPSVVTGVHFVFSGAAVQPNLIRVDPGSPAYRVGLRSGDLLGCLSMRDYSLLEGPSVGFTHGYDPGTPISTCVKRGGRLQEVRFVANTGPPVPNTYGSNALAALRVCVVLVFFLTGIALVMARPSPMTWIFYAYCIGSAPSFAAQEVWTILPSWQYAIAVGLPEFGSQTAVAYLLLFSVLVPDLGIPDGWRRSAFYGACAVAAADVVFALLNTFGTSVTFAPSLANTADEALTAVTVLLVVARLATMQRAERARFGWAAFAIIFGVVTNDLRNVLSLGSYGSVSVAAADLTIVMPLCLTYAILRRHVIDVRFVISRGVVYAALTTLVVGVIGIVDWITSAYLSQVRVAMAIDALVTIFLAFALHRAYGWVEAAVDFILFRRKHDAEAYLNRMAKTLLRAKREETIDHALVHAPYERLDLTMAALFRASGSSFAASAVAGWNPHAALAFDSDDELVRFLVTERTKLHIRDLRKHVAAQFEGHGASPAIAIPLFQGDDLVAFAVYGIHRDGTRLDPDEIETLERLCDVAAQAYTGIELARYRGGRTPLLA